MPSLTCAVPGSPSAATRGKRAARRQDAEERWRVRRVVRGERDTGDDRAEHPTEVATRGHDARRERDVALRHGVDRGDARRGERERHARAEKQ
jgi:hypothetical protein